MGDRWRKLEASHYLFPTLEAAAFASNSDQRQGEMLSSCFQHESISFETKSEFVIHHHRTRVRYESKDFFMKNAEYFGDGLARLIRYSKDQAIQVNYALVASECIRHWALSIAAFMQRGDALQAW